jgi:hypothetical protein
MATRSHGKLASLQETGSRKNLHGRGDFLGSCWLDNTVRRQSALPVEVRSKASIVCILTREGHALGYRAQGQDFALEKVRIAKQDDVDLTQSISVSF